MGLIGPVQASADELDEHPGLPAAGWAEASPAGTIVTDSAWRAWLVTMNTTGPAPTEAGEIDTLWSLM